MICGEKTTTQQAMEIDLYAPVSNHCKDTSRTNPPVLLQWEAKSLESYPQIPLRASRSRLPAWEGNMSKEDEADELDQNPVQSDDSRTAY
jgi:hypothetical protein